MRSTFHLMVRAVLPAALASSIVLCACGPQKDDSDGHGGGTGDGTSDGGDGGGGTEGSGGGGTGSGGSGGDTDTSGTDVTGTASETCVLIEQVDPPVDTCDLHSCEEVMEVWMEIRQSYRSCEVEQDCVVVSDTFDFTCDCGDAINQDGAAAQEPLRSRWSYLGCDPDCGPSGEDCAGCDCEPPSFAVCTDGQCQGGW